MLSHHDTILERSPLGASEQTNNYDHDDRDPLGTMQGGKYPNNKVLLILMCAVKWMSRKMDGGTSKGIWFCLAYGIA